MIDLVDHSDLVRLGTSHYSPSVYNYGHNPSVWVVRDTSDQYNVDPLISDTSLYPSANCISLLEFRRPQKFSVIDNFQQGTDSTRSSVNTIHGYKPSPFDMPVGLNRLAAITHLTRFLSGESDDKVVTNEHNVAHVNLSGTIHIGAVENQRPGGPDGDFFYGAYVDPGNPSTYTLYGHSYDVGIANWDIPTVDVVGWITERYEAGLYTQYGGLWNANSEIQNLRFIWQDGCLQAVTYTLINTGWGMPGDGITDYLAYKVYKVGLGVIWGVPHPWLQTGPTTDGQLWRRVGATLVKYIKCVKQYSRNYGEPPVWYISPSTAGSNPLNWSSSHSFRGDGAMVWACNTSPRRQWEAYSGISGPGGYRKINSGITSLAQFRDDVRNVSKDLLCMGFLAQGDAYDTQFQVVKTNLVEFLTELADIASLLESPADLVIRFIVEGKTRNTFRAIKLFLDTLSDAKLYYSFMLQPTVKLAAEMAQKASRLSKVFETYLGYQTINGKANYVVGEEFPNLTDCVVVGRSKLRVRIPPDSLLAALMPLEKLHLLPDLSNYWETLRLSFVVDWFFNVQSKLDVIDKTIRFMALDVGTAVNSVAVYKPIIPSGFVVEDDACWKYYTRYVLTAPQVFTPTRLNVLGGTGVPSFVTAGALLYKFT